MVPDEASRTLAFRSTINICIVNFWLLGLARVAYREVTNDSSLLTRGGIVGASVILGGTNLLYLFSLGYYLFYKCCDDGQVAAFLGGLFQVRLCGGLLVGASDR